MQLSDQDIPLQTDTSKPFNAAYLILSDVWYSQDYINQREKTIDFSGIDAAEAQVRASDEELAITRLARTCYAQEGFIKDLQALSIESRCTVLVAINELF